MASGAAGEVGGSRIRQWHAVCGGLAFEIFTLLVKGTLTHDGFPYNDGRSFLFFISRFKGVKNFRGIIAIDEDDALGGIVKAGDEIDDGGLAAAGSAQKGDGLTRFRHKINMRKDRVTTLVIAEGDIVELDIALDLRQFDGVRFIFYSIFSVENTENALSAGTGLTHLAYDETQLADGEKDIDQVETEFLPFTEGECAID